MMAYEVEFQVEDSFGTNVGTTALRYEGGDDRAIAGKVLFFVLAVGAVVEFIEHGAALGRDHGDKAKTDLEKTDVVYRVTNMLGGDSAEAAASRRLLLPNGLENPLDYSDTMWSVRLSVGRYALSHLVINGVEVDPDYLTLRDEDWLEMQQAALEADDQDEDSDVGDGDGDGAAAVAALMDQGPKQSAKVFGGAVGGGDAVLDLDAFFDRQDARRRQNAALLRSLGGEEAVASAAALGDEGPQEELRRGALPVVAWPTKPLVVTAVVTLFDLFCAVSDVELDAGHDQSLPAGTTVTLYAAPLKPRKSNGEGDDANGEETGDNNNSNNNNNNNNNNNSSDNTGGT